MRSRLPGITWGGVVIFWLALMVARLSLDQPRQAQATFQTADVDAVATAAPEVPPPADEPVHPLAKYAPELGYSIEPYGIAKWDNGLRLSRWVLHEVTAETIEGDADRSEFDFFADPSIDSRWRTQPGWFMRAQTHDDRGHYAPCADFKYSKRITKACMSLKNIGLQNSDLNEHEWSRMEAAVRKLTSGGRLKVLTGPAWKSDGKPIVTTRVVHGMLEPTHWFKAVLLEPVEAEKECLAWLARNTSDAGHFDSWRLSTDDLEVDVGFKIWPNLTAAEAKRLKKTR